LQVARYVAYAVATASALLSLFRILATFKVVLQDQLSKSAGEELQPGSCTRNPMSGSLELLQQRRAETRRQLGYPEALSYPTLAR